MKALDKLKYNEQGLIPAVVQDFYTGEVLMMAWMNKQSIEISMQEGKTCFYSRSRQELWRKGETSGNTQDIVSVSADCDGDTLLIKVIPAGPACHTGAKSCFYEDLYRNGDKSDFSLDTLYEMLQDRKDKMPQGSYTTYLFEKGDDKILKKVGEECTEVIIGAKNQDMDELRYEIADLTYHVMVLMVQKGLSVSEIKEELARRHVIDKKVKQEKMGGGEE